MTSSSGTGEGTRAVRIQAADFPANPGPADQVTGREPNWPVIAAPGSAAWDMRIQAARDRIAGGSCGRSGPAVTSAHDAAITVPLRGPARSARDRSGAWLRNAALGLGVLAAAAAAV